MSLLETKQLQKQFGKLMAVDGVDLEVTDRELRAIIGPNGAGKSTLFGLITGKLRPTFGRIIYKGEDITNLPVHQRINKGMGISFQITSIFQDLTVFDNVRIGVIRRMGKHLSFFRSINKFRGINEKTLDILELIGMSEKGAIAAGQLSHGDKRILEIGISLSNDPELLFLDEPTAGMNPIETKNTVDLIKSLSEKKEISIIITEHDMAVVFELAERITVLQEGKVIAEGTPNDIKGNAKVRTAYLGEEESELS